MMALQSVAHGLTARIHFDIYHNPALAEFYSHVKDEGSEMLKCCPKPRVSKLKVQLCIPPDAHREATWNFPL